MSRFYHKHFLKLLDFTPAELNSLLQLAAKLKADKKSGKEEAKLTGKNIALIFEKDSTRTRCSFEVAAYDQVLALLISAQAAARLVTKSRLKTLPACLVACMTVFSIAAMVRRLSKHWRNTLACQYGNGLTNEFHPTQLLADLTMVSICPAKHSNEMTLVYAGDVTTWATRCSKLRRLPVWTCDWSHHSMLAGSCAGRRMQCSAQKHGGKITLTEDIASGG